MQFMMSSTLALHPNYTHETINTIYPEDSANQVHIHADLYTVYYM